MLISLYCELEILICSLSLKCVRVQPLSLQPFSWLSLKLNQTLGRCKFQQFHFLFAMHIRQEHTSLYFCDYCLLYS